jgi:hypothetical protein
MAAPRPDLFTPIHKAIRALLYDLATEAHGRVLERLAAA